MSRLLYSAAMSLDGFIAGPGGDMQWLARASGDGGAPDPVAEGLAAQVGALLLGRRTWGGDDPNAGTDAEGAFGGTWHGPTVVLTHDPPAEAPPDVVFSSDLGAAVETARAAARDRYVNVLGADVAGQCLRAGLLDEVLVLLVPVLLGDGTRLFSHPGGHEVALTVLADRSGPGALWCSVG